MAKKRSVKTGIILLLILILFTLFISPFGIFYKLRVATLSTFSFIMETFGLYEGYTTENERLKYDNQRLVTLVKEKEKEIHKLNKELKHFGVLEEYETVKQGTLISAQVIFYDPSSTDSRVILNKGTDDGVVKGAVVMEGEFLLGRIIAVSESTSEVLLVNDIHSLFSVSVGKEGIAGIIKGNGKGFMLIVKYIDNQPENIVQKGDVVMTSGYSRGVPPRILIGKVCNNPQKDTKNYNEYIYIKVKPFVNTLTVKKVCVFVYTPHPQAEKNRQ
jgi:rod shape-determining protein MreC